MLQLSEAHALFYKSEHFIWEMALALKEDIERNYKYRHLCADVEEGPYGVIPPPPEVEEEYRRLKERRSKLKSGEVGPTVEQVRR